MTLSDLNLEKVCKKPTPSAASIKITTPSDNRNAAVTSSEKFTCPKIINKNILMAIYRCSLKKVVAKTSFS